MVPPRTASVRGRHLPGRLLVAMALPWRRLAGRVKFLKVARVFRGSPPDMTAISHHTALIYVMVIVSASDGSMSEKELKTISELTKTLPSFDDFDHHRLLAVCQECAQILQEPDGAEAALGLIDEGLPDVLHETAYWVALEVALAD